MATNEFVKALRGDSEPGEVTPLSWLETAIESLADLEKAGAERDEDPGAYSMMVMEAQNLCKNLKAALADHDKTGSRRSDDLCDINSLYGCPGADYESSTGIDLLCEVLSEFGLTAFTNNFLLQLAARHRAEDERAA